MRLWYTIVKKTPMSRTLTAHATEYHRIEVTLKDLYSLLGLSALERTKWTLSKLELDGKGETPDTVVVGVRVELILKDTRNDAD